MPKKKWHWLLLLALMGAAPFLYAIIQGYWALLWVPVAGHFSVAGKVPWLVLIVTMNFAGALIVASLLSLPLGYAASDRPYLFGALLSVAPVAFMFWAVDDKSELTIFHRASRAAEYLGAVVAFVAMAGLGAFLKQRSAT